MATLSPFDRSWGQPLRSIFYRSLVIVPHYKEAPVNKAFYSIELAMTLHPTFEVDSAHKPGSNDEDLEQVEFTSVKSPDPNLYRSDVDTSTVDLGKLKRKIDFRLVPWLALLYLMNFLDRGSIGNARVRSVSTFYPLL